MTYKFKVKAPDQIDVPRICRENKDKDGFVIRFGDIVIFASKDEFELELMGMDLRILKQSYSSWPSFLPDATLQLNSRLSVPSEELHLFRFICLIEENKEKQSELITEFFKVLTRARSSYEYKQNIKLGLSRKQREVLVTTKS